MRSSLVNVSCKPEQRVPVEGLCRDLRTWVNMESYMIFHADYESGIRFALAHLWNYDFRHLILKLCSSPWLFWVPGCRLSDYAGTSGHESICDSTWFFTLNKNLVLDFVYDISEIMLSGTKSWRCTADKLILAISQVRVPGEGPCRDLTTSNYI